jgi:predicted tellurium resistance membrane protein TerC
MRGVRKTLALAGLGVLGVIGYQLMVGQIDLVDAAWRAAAVMFALMLLQWLIRLVVVGYLRNLERERARAAAAVDAAREPVELRRSDGSGAG